MATRGNNMSENLTNKLKGTSTPQVEGGEGPLKNPTPRPPESKASGSIDEPQNVVECGGKSGADSRTSTVKSFRVEKNRTSSFKRMNVTSQRTVEIVPTFLEVKMKEGDFSKISPFVIDKVLSDCVGVVKSVKKTRSGLLVECTNMTQSKKLMLMKTFQNTEVEVSPHGYLNYSRGVVTCRDLSNYSLAEIEENMKEQGVIGVKRIMVKRDGVFQDTASLILTFNKLTPPQRVKAGIHSLPVRFYIPSPLRCFKCQKFGHTSSRCEKPQICVCGQDIHEGSPCKDPITCVNCGGEHSARSRNCPVYKEEVAIQKVRIEERLSFAEAKRKIKGSTPSNTSYAQVVRSPAPSSIKEIVRELIPEITTICTEMIKRNLSGTNTNQSMPVIHPQVAFRPPPIPAVSTYETSQNAAQVTSEMESDNLSEKRKRDVRSRSTSVTEDASESEVGETMSHERRKKKAGWPKGKSRKKPGSNSTQR